LHTIATACVPPMRVSALLREDFRDALGTDKNYGDTRLPSAVATPWVFFQDLFDPTLGYGFFMKTLGFCCAFIIGPSWVSSFL